MKNEFWNSGFEEYALEKENSYFALLKGTRDKCDGKVQNVKLISGFYIQNSYETWNKLGKDPCLRCVV